MRSSVAFLLVLITFSSGAVVQGQTPSRRTNQSTVSKPRTETLKICQGLPVPDGYVIIAYMTSSACAHGAYLLKKQADYDASVSADRDANQPAAESTEQSSASAKPLGSTARRTGTSTPVRNSAKPVQPSNDPRTSTQMQTNSTLPATSASRPRRVSVTSQAANQTQATIQSPGANQLNNASQASDASQTNDAPPTLIGSALGPPPRPPVLSTPGANQNTSSTSISDATTSTAPEEVGEGDIVRVNTTLVSVPVSVLDRQGRFVANLQRDDFKIFENGVEQPIAYFEPADKPFTVALLLDTSASTHFHLEEIREAAIEFAKQLRPQDRVLIVSFNDEVLLLTEATNDLGLVETVIEENANTGNSTRLYDAVDLTIKERLNKIKGRKAIVLFTDGVDTSSQQATFQSTLSEVQELDALIYPIQYDTTDYLRAMQDAGNGTVTVVTTRRGPFGTTTSQQTYNAPMNGGVPLPGTTKADYDRADRYLHALADETGGRLYEANDTTQLSQAFTKIAEELRRQYSLGYYPKNDNGDSSDRRQIRVKVRQPNLAVKARDSYAKPAGKSRDK